RTTESTWSGTLSAKPITGISATLAGSIPVRLPHHHPPTHETTQWGCARLQNPTRGIPVSLAGSIPVRLRHHHPPTHETTQWGCAGLRDGRGTVNTATLPSRLSAASPHRRVDDRRCGAEPVFVPQESAEGGGRVTVGRVLDHVSQGTLERSHRELAPGDRPGTGPDRGDPRSPEGL